MNLLYIYFLVEEIFQSSIMCFNQHNFHMGLYGLALTLPFGTALTTYFSVYWTHTQNNWNLQFTHLKFQEDFVGFGSSFFIKFHYISFWKFVLFIQKILSQWCFAILFAPIAVSFICELYKNVSKVDTNFIILIFILKVSVFWRIRNEVAIGLIRLKITEGKMDILTNFVAYKFLVNNEEL